MNKFLSKHLTLVADTVTSLGDEDVNGRIYIQRLGSGAIYIGNDGENSVSKDTGFALLPWEPISMIVDKLSDVYAISVDGEGELSILFENSRVWRE